MKTCKACGRSKNDWIPCVFYIWKEKCAQYHNVYAKGDKMDDTKIYSYEIDTANLILPTGPYFLEILPNYVILKDGKTNNTFFMTYEQAEDLYDHLKTEFGEKE